MQSVLRAVTQVLPGGQVTVSDPTLQEGQTVEVIVVPGASPAPKPLANDGQSIVEFLESLPREERPPGYWEERDREFQRERDSWDR